MNSKTSLVTAVCIAAIVLGATSSAPAKGKKTAPATPSATVSASPMEKKKSARAIGFHGKIASVDATAKTFTVGTRTIKVTDETKLTKQGAAATMADIVADEEVRGSYWKKENGSLEGKNVKLGPKSESEMSADAQKKEKRAREEAAPSTSPASSP